MTPEQAAAYVYSQAVAAYAEIESMKALNEERRNQGLALAYDEDSFMDLIQSYGLHHNAVVQTFQNAKQGAA